MVADLASAPYQKMGPQMLASEPSMLPYSEGRPGDDWDAIFSHLESRLQGLRSWRYSWWQHWNELAAVLLPRRAHWTIVANRMWKGAQVNTGIIDSSPTLAMQICAAGLWTGLTSPSRPWFKLGIALPWVELDKDGQDWLEDTEQKVYTVLAQSNFYNTMAQAFQDVATFGTSPVLIYEDFEDVIRCYLPCAGEYFLAAGSRFSVDTLYREFVMTVAELVEMFNLENCPTDVVKLWEEGGGGLEREFVVCHSIEPNFPIAGRGGKKGKQIRAVPARFTFREFYWLRGMKATKELSRRGFVERPFMVARWSVVSNDAYGRSPGMDALGDTRQIQQETRRKGEYIDKLVRPPMGADPSLKNEPSSIIPGNITYVSAADGKKGFWPLFEVNPMGLKAIIDDIDKVEERINRCFFVDVFMAISRMEGVQPRNELELTKRDLERLQVLGPFINMFETEFAGPAIERVLAILQRRKMLRPMPQSLQNVPIKINYVSIMKLAQRSAESVAMKDVLATAGGLSAAAKAAGVPDPIRILDLDKAMRIYADLSNYPIEAVFTEDEVKQHDQIRQQEQQKMQALAATQAGVDAAKTLSETQIAPGNALGAVMGGGQ